MKPSKEVEALLFAAARLNTYNVVIKPSLNIGTTVICDRYLMDAYAYSCNDKVGVTTQFISRINIGYRDPDITFLLDIDPEVSLERIQGSKDHYEKVDFLQSVRDTYLKMVKYPKLFLEGQNWIVLDGSKPINVIQSLVWEKVQKIL